MTIAIMSAMHEENESIVNAMNVTNEEKLGSRTYFTGLLNEQNIVVVFSHWGKVAAAITATTLITKFAVDEIIFTGVAGSIDKSIHVGDIVIAKNLYQHDMDVRPIIDRHEIPLLGRAEIETAPELQIKLQQAANRFLENDYANVVGNTTASGFNIDNPSIYTGDIASGDQFISDSSIAQGIRTRLPTVACIEMEGAAVAQVCESFNIPFGLVRTISDSADEASEIDFPAFIAKIAQAYSLGIIKNYLSE